MEIIIIVLLAGINFGLYRLWQQFVNFNEKFSGLTTIAQDAYDIFAGRV